MSVISMDASIIPSQPRQRRNIFRRSIQRLSGEPETLYNSLKPHKNETRLIRLLSGTRSSRIKCTLFHIDLDPPPAYAALSYTWREPSIVFGYTADEPPCTITCNNVKISVARNLEAALRQLRSPSEDRILWIDALCINQEDLLERNQQVQKMGSIYRKAEKVIVWLGEESSDSKLGLQLARALNEKDADYGKWLLDKEKFGNYFAALISLFDREYWSRVWVIQETALASDIIVFCGKECIPWSYLDAIPTILLRHKERLWSTLIDSHQDYYGLFESGPTALHVYPDDPLMMLCVHRDKKALDPRDKVFALVGVVPTLNSPGLVNYSRSVEDIYQEVFEIVVSHTKSLDIICASGGPSDLAASWVPDWSYQADRSSFIVQKVPYRAAGSSHPVVRFSERILRCRGFLIGSIGEVGSVSSCANLKFEDLEWFVGLFHEWFRFVYSFAPDTDATQESFLRTIHLGEPRPEGERYSSREWRSSFMTNMVILTQALQPDMHIDERLQKYVLVGRQDVGRDGLLSRVNRKWILDVTYSTHHRRIFASRQGSIGFAPIPANSGDLICILLGCSCPVILRPDHDGYTLVGEAYVDGFMKGEAMDGLRDGWYREQTFKLY